MTDEFSQTDYFYDNCGRPEEESNTIYNDFITIFTNSLYPKYDSRNEVYESKHIVRDFDNFPHIITKHFDFDHRGSIIRESFEYGLDCSFFSTYNNTMRMKIKIQNLRENYQKNQLALKDLHEDPITQFKKWLDDAIDSKVKEPTAMALGTMDADGNPSTRIVLLKDINEDGLIFYTNQESEKGKNIKRNDNVSLLFFWIQLERQVRIKGVTTKVSDDVATAYFQSRPKKSQIGAWASNQSEIIDDRSTLEKRVKDLEKKHEMDEVLPKPEYWGGYSVKPHDIEFWQGRRDRLHDRFRYKKDEGNCWNIDRLSP